MDTEKILNQFNIEMMELFDGIRVYAKANEKVLQEFVIAYNKIFKDMKRNVCAKK